MNVKLNIKDAVAGLIFFGFGLLFLSDAVRTLDLGTASSMGPGYFPAVLGGVLMILATAIIGRSFFSSDFEVTKPSWRAIALITAAPVIFGITINDFGLLIATAGTVLVSALASRRVSRGMLLFLVVSLTAFCVVVFNLGLGLPLQLIGPFLRF